MSMEPGFVYLDEVLPGVRWDAKYATWDNFTGTPVDGYEVNRVVGSDALADALRDATTRAAAVAFTVATYGINTGGTVYRMDDVPIPLHAILPGPPDAATVCRMLCERLAGAP